MGLRPSVLARSLRARRILSLKGQGVAGCVMPGFTSDATGEGPDEPSAVVASVFRPASAGSAGTLGAAHSTPTRARAREPKGAVGDRRTLLAARRYGTAR